MALEIEGRLNRINPIETGYSQSTNKEWKKQLFVITYDDGAYPRKLAFIVWGDNTELLKNLKVGDKLRVYFRLESREFNNKWYTDAVAWKIVKIVEEDLSRKERSAGGDSPSPEEAIYNTGTSDVATEDPFSATEDIPEDDFSSEGGDDDDMPF